MLYSLIMKEREALISLAAFVPFGPVRIKLLIEYFGSATKAYSVSSKKLREIGLGEKLVSEFDKHRRSFKYEEYAAKLDKYSIRVITQKDDQYPKLLLEIENAPTVLYVRGELKQADSVAIAVVGSRKVTSYGKEVAYKIASELAASGITVVSGLALGVDSIAHQAALDVGGRTIAVLGNGLDTVYPPTHRVLAQKIVKNGALISEYPLGYPAMPYNFPQRNRIVSGISLGVVVIEGTEKSGTLLTASHAAAQGREVFAVPGPITSPNAGAPNILLRNGAKLVTSAKDILEELDLGTRHLAIGNREILPETKEEIELFAILEIEPLHVDEITRRLGKDTGVVLSTITTMELKGMIKNIGNGVYGRI